MSQHVRTVIRVSLKNVKWSPSPGRHIPVQQPSVLSDLHLQSGLDVQQHLVLLSLSAQIGSELHQLLLHVGHLVLVASQRHGVAVRDLCQGALQRRFLHMDTNQPKQSVRLLSDNNSLDFGSGAVKSIRSSVILYGSDDWFNVWFTMLSCDCSSISRLCRVLLTSVISDLDVLRVCVLTTTSVLRFSDYFRGGERKVLSHAFINHHVLLCI